MFEVKENENYENVELEYPYLLYQDGTIIPDIGVREIDVWNEKNAVMEKAFEIEAFDDKSKFLTNYKIEDFTDSISKVCLYGWDYFEDFQFNTTIYFNHGFLEFYVDFELIPNFAFWKRRFSFVEYREIFHEILLEQFSDWGFIPSNYKYKEFSEIELTISHKFEREKISEELDPYKKILEKIHAETVEILSKNEKINTINSSFNFPEEVKISCEQYLLYFAKFLKDLGINATSNLKEEAGKVLFSVTPTDDVEALDKIREALAVYLNLPASPISDLEYSENFALMRLQQQVRNLQHSQQMAKTELLSAQYALSLAQSNFENQDQIIVRQHSTIENLNKVIEKITSNSIMTDSLDKKDKEEFEEVCEGLRVGESKWLRELTGVGLSSGKFVKAIVKNTFGKEEKNSILGLDEE